MCVQCSRSAGKRASRRYSAVRKHAGDVALTHHFYAAAGQHYQDALNMIVSEHAPDASGSDDRLSEKIIHALSLGNEPGAAISWCYRLLSKYLATPGNGEKAVGILLRLSQQLWLNSKPMEAIPLIKRAIGLAETIGNRNLKMQATLTISTRLVLLGNYDEARKFWNLLETLDHNAPVFLRAMYYEQRAHEAAIRGKGPELYRYSDAAIAAVQKGGTSSQILGAWYRFSYLALTFGDVECAKSCAERALLISRQNRLIWRTSYAVLAYAEILAYMGRYDLVHELVIEAISYDAKSSVLEKLLAEHGIPIALRMKDDRLLAQCSGRTALTLALRSQEPETIGSVSAAFAQLYQARGNPKEAQALLHRAIHATRPSLCNWKLPLEVARQGALANIPSARHLLETWVEWTGSDIARACMDLFDALVARREGKSDLSHVRAHSALQMFETRHWYAYADEARAMLPATEEIPRSNRQQSSPLAGAQTLLTAREMEIAAFVLRGLTNRAIASRLSITENTVEKHMTSIMNRLGIRSRYQLTDVIDKEAII